MSDVHMDNIEIINGPEDGIVFPITRVQFTIGASADCAVFLNYDRNICPVHARVTVVSGGYRFRSVSGAPVFINGKRSGMVWARCAHSGDVIRVGDTSLHLSCGPDGLAGRSIGVPTESNFVWLIRILFQQLSRMILILYRLCFRMLSRLNRAVLFILVAVLALTIFKPGLLPYLAWYAWTWIRYFWARLGAG